MSKLDDLEKIQELKNKGILTQDEFEIEKQKILNEKNDNNENKEDVYSININKKILYSIFIIIVIMVVIIGIIVTTSSKSNKDINSIEQNELNIIEQIDDNNKTNELNVTKIEDNSNSSIIENNNLPIATIEVENYGTMKIELYYNEAPNTVKNFIALANNGFYNNLTFHRIVKDFIIQGGDKNGDGTGNATLSAIDQSIIKGTSADIEYSIEGEFSENGIENNIKFEKGTIAMARADYSAYSPSITKEGYNSASSQFFIVTEDTTTGMSSLNGKYAPFGKVIEGMEILDKLNNVNVIADSDEPLQPPVIASIKVDTKGNQYDLPKTKEVFDIKQYITNLYNL